jgi:hypothetical protein
VATWMEPMALYVLPDTYLGSKQDGCAVLKILVMWTSTAIRCRMQDRLLGSPMKMAVPDPSLPPLPYLASMSSDLDTP